MKSDSRWTLFDCKNAWSQKIKNIEAEVSTMDKKWYCDTVTCLCSTDITFIQFHSSLNPNLKLLQQPADSFRIKGRRDSKQSCSITKNNHVQNWEYSNFRLISGITPLLHLAESTKLIIHMVYHHKVKHSGEYRRFNWVHTFWVLEKNRSKAEMWNTLVLYNVFDHHVG